MPAEFKEVMVIRCRNCMGENLSWNLECNRCGHELEFFDELSQACDNYTAHKKKMEQAA